MVAEFGEVSQATGQGERRQRPQGIAKSLANI